VNKFVVRKFFKWAPNGNRAIPVGLNRMINFDHADIIKYYNAVVRGLLNYYSFVDNINRLRTIVEYLRYSCRRTLAKKFKLKTMAATFKKFGKN
jgi:Type II intron maturase